jgi:hypothetical protein
VVGMVVRWSIGAASGLVEKKRPRVEGNAVLPTRGGWAAVYCVIVRRKAVAGVPGSVVLEGFGGCRFDRTCNRVGGRRWWCWLCSPGSGAWVCETRSKSDDGGARGDAGNCARNESGSVGSEGRAAHWARGRREERVVFGVAPHESSGGGC